MARRTREERQQAVIAAAADRILRTEIDWSASVTVSEIAIETGIDQQQIFRDFGSKQGLIDAVVAAMFDPSQNEVYLDATRKFTETIIRDGISFAEMLTHFGRYYEQIVMDVSSQLISRQYALWAFSEADTVEWELARKLSSTLLDASTSIAQVMVDQLVERGAVRRDQLSVREFTTLNDALIEGLIIKYALTPELVPKGLLANATGALLAAVIGPDDETPIAALDRIPRSTT